MTLSIMTLSIISEHCSAECRLCWLSLMLSVTYKPLMLSVVASWKATFVSNYVPCIQLETRGGGCLRVLPCQIFDFTECVPSKVVVCIFPLSKFKSDKSHEWCQYFKCVLTLVLASVINYDRKWCHTMEHNLLMTLEAPLTITICLKYRPMVPIF